MKKCPYNNICNTPGKPNKNDPSCMASRYKIRGNKKKTLCFYLPAKVSKIKRVEKALNRACYILANYGFCMLRRNFEKCTKPNTFTPTCKKCWKDYLLKE